jgi:hypothetical protein
MSHVLKGVADNVDSVIGMLSSTPENDKKFITKSKSANIFLTNYINIAFRRTFAALGTAQE